MLTTSLFKTCFLKIWFKLCNFLTGGRRLGMLCAQTSSKDNSTVVMQRRQRANCSPMRLGCYVQSLWVRVLQLITIADTGCHVSTVALIVSRSQQKSITWRRVTALLVILCISCKLLASTWSYCDYFGMDEFTIYAGTSKKVEKLGTINCWSLLVNFDDR